MQVNEIMTPDPMVCTPFTALDDVARLMCENICGAVPVVENENSRKLVGIVTDRDIVCRIVSHGRNPADMTADDCMSDPVIAVTQDTSLEECCRLLEEHQIRRLPVVDQDGNCCGIVAQADLVQHVEPNLCSEMLKEVSKPTGIPARV
jgi:CBS domain-containing protein